MPFSSFNSWTAAESEKQKKLAEEAQQNQQTPSDQPTAETIIEEKTTPTVTPTTTSEVAPQNINKVEEQGVDQLLVDIEKLINEN